MTAPPNLRAPELLGQPRTRYQINCAGAQLHVHARSQATVLRIEGEIDASNAGPLMHAIRPFSRLRAPLVLDLGGLDFIGVAGLRELLNLRDEHRRSQVYCAIVGGAALRRLTRAVPTHGLPIVDSVADALGYVENVIQARRRFVSGPARQQEPQCRAAAWIGGVA